jgi:hypothetical protein
MLKKVFVTLVALSLVGCAGRQFEEAPSAQVPIEAGPGITAADWAERLTSNQLDVDTRLSGIDTALAGKEAAGAAATAISSHTALANPHPGYTDAAELTAALSTKYGLNSSPVFNNITGESLSIVGSNGYNQLSLENNTIDTNISPGALFKLNNVLNYKDLSGVNHSLLTASGGDSKYVETYPSYSDDPGSAGEYASSGLTTAIHNGTKWIVYTGVDSLDETPVTDFCAGTELFCADFENNQTCVNAGWTVAGSTSDCQATDYKIELYGLKLNDTGTDPTIKIATTTNQGNAYLKFNFRSSAASTTNYFVKLLESNLTTSIVRVYTSSTGLKLYVGTGSTETLAISSDTWYTVKVYYNNSTGATDGTAYLWYTEGTDQALPTATGSANATFAAHNLTSEVYGASFSSAAGSVWIDNAKITIGDPDA